MTGKKETINQRFIAAFRELEKQGIITTKAEAARTLGIEPQRMNEILKGRLNVGTHVLTIFFTHYGVDPDYIFLGEMPMFRNKPGMTGYSGDGNVSLAAEKEGSYEKKGSQIEIQVRRKVKGVETIEYVSLKELSEALGIEDLHKKLDELLSRPSPKGIHSDKSPRRGDLPTRVAKAPKKEKK